MSRRDTIIIAVLVNAALLMILFATAIRTGDSTDTKKSAIQFASAPPHPAPIQDELLNEFVSGTATLADTAGESLFPFEEVEIAIVPQKPVPTYVAQDNTQAPYSPPLAIAPRTEKSDGQYVDITVKKGDFLEKIAKANNTTVTAIMKANNLSSTQLKIGQILKIPLTRGGSTPAQPSSQTVPTITGEYYVVKEGDNPWLIASRNKINLEELLRINGLDDQKAKRLRPGDKLKIR